MNQFCNILSNALSSAGLNQTEAALKIGIERKTLNSYVKGRTEPDFQTLGKIARALNIGNEIYELIMEQCVPHGTSDEYKEKYILQLEKTDKLRDKIDEMHSSLVELLMGQKALRAQVKTVLENEAWKLANGNPKKFQSELARLKKLTEVNLDEVQLNAGSMAGS